MPIHSDHFKSFAPRVKVPKSSHSFLAITLLSAMHRTSQPNSFALPVRHWLWVAAFLIHSFDCIPCFAQVVSLNSTAIHTAIARGQIVDEEGAPLKNVSLTPCLFDSSVSLEDRSVTLTADEQGRWEWDIRTHPHIYCLRASRVGFMPCEIPIVGNSTRRTVLKFASSVQGFVVDELDREVEGATVALVEASNEIAPTPIASTVSDNRGWFELFGVIDSNASLRAWTTGGKAGAVQDNFAIHKRPLTIEIKEPKQLEIQITDSSGTPIPSALITLKSWNRTGIFTWSQRSNSFGLSQWEHAPAGLLSFEIECEGFQTVWQHIQVDKSQKVSIQLRRLKEIVSNVIDDETSHPVERFLVIPSAEKVNSLFVPKLELAGWYCGSRIPINAIIQKQGRLPLESIPFFDSSDVEIVALGYSRYKFRMDRLTEFKHASEIRLKRPNTVSNATCTLLNPNGTPCEGTNVMYISQGGITIATNADPLATQLQWPYHIYQQMTDQKGNFFLNARPEFEFVSAWNEYGSFAGLTRNLAQQQTITLVPYSKLELRVTSKFFGPFVRFAIQQTVELDRDKSFAKAHFYTPLNEISDGTYESRSVPSGSISIVCQSFDPMTKKFDSYVVAALNSKPNENIELHLTGTSSIRGKIILLGDGQDAAAWQELPQTQFECVATYVDPLTGLNIYRKAVAQKDGSFEIRGLVASEYLLEFLPKSSADKNVRTGQFATKFESNVSQRIRLGDSESLDLGKIHLSFPER